MPTDRPPLACDKCRTVLTGAVVNTVEPVNCPGCHSPLIVEVFPAYFRPPAAGQAAENVLSDEDASCFYHPAKKAVVPCARCGRFLCALCDIELGANRHVCPGCVEAARQDPGGKMDLTGGGAATDALGAQRRLLPDQLAITLAVLPLFFLYWLTFITAPIVLYIVIRYWKEPGSVVNPRSRTRLIVAAIFALLELCGWLAVLYFIYNRRTHGF